MKPYKATKVAEKENATSRDLTKSPEEDLELTEVWYEQQAEQSKDENEKEPNANESPNVTEQQSDPRYSTDDQSKQPSGLQQDSPSPPPLRRSTRTRRPPDWYGDVVTFSE